MIRLAAATILMMFAPAMFILFPNQPLIVSLIDAVVHAIGAGVLVHIALGGGQP